MKPLFKKRLAAHLKEQTKYLQRVFNDHFILALLILLGAVLYAYAGFVKSLKPSWVLAPILALISTAALGFGDLASLTQKADATFLLPQTTNFSKYLFKARRYSLLLPTVALVMLCLAIAPVLAVGSSDPLVRAGMVALGLFSLKDVDLWWRLFAFYTLPKLLAKRYSRAIFFVAIFGALSLGLWTHPVWFALAAVFFNLAFRLVIVSTMKAQTLDWLSLVAHESRRSERIYRFYNLFTDVPGLGGGVRRLRALDFLVKQLNAGKSTPWRFLLTRGFVRRSTYFGLYLRLWVIGTLILGLLSLWWLALLLAALFVYLVGFQLMPLLSASDEIVFTHLYPLEKGSRERAFSSLMRRVLVVFGLLLAVGPLTFGRFKIAGLVAVVGGLVALLFTELYLPLRTRARLRKS